MTQIIRREKLFILTIFIDFAPLFAQFNTIRCENLQEAVVVVQKPNIHAVNKSASRVSVDIDTAAQKKLRLQELLEERCEVSLPLDLMKTTSRYGYRNDPFKKCRKFHDGIDLHCRNQAVYAMMPGTVKKVVHGNTGYGNHVVIEHGDLECLYGHLSRIHVRVGDRVDAGRAVAVSGNTGRSTAPHLHILLKRNGKSINPQPFIDFLNDYIFELNEAIEREGGVAASQELNERNVRKVIDRYGLHSPDIVLAQSVLETGHYQSDVCRRYNNLFGLYDSRKGDYYRFDRWEDSVYAYKKYIQYKYKGGDYYEFLKRIGYAEDVTYVSKVREMVRQQKRI